MNTNQVAGLLQPARWVFLASCLALVHAAPAVAFPDPHLAIEAVVFHDQTGWVKPSRAQVVLNPDGDGVFVVAEGGAATARSGSMVWLVLDQVPYALNYVAKKATGGPWPYELDPEVWKRTGLDPRTQVSVNHVTGQLEIVVLAIKHGKLQRTKVRPFPVQ